MKRLSVIFSFVFLTFILFNVSVNAEDYYYVNDNGITFTREEYDYFTKMYYDGYQATMTEEDMAYFDGVELNPDLVEVVEYEEPVSFLPGGYSIMGSYYETTAKKLKIAKSNATYPLISVVLTWKKSPAVRSYDLIGAYLSVTSLVSDPVSKLTSSAGTINASATKELSNGFGASIKLPNSGSNIVVSQTYTVFPGGTVYASYQHAKSSISLSDSQTFTISYSGLGHVFYFSNSTITAKYDAMGGVSIAV